MEISYTEQAKGYQIKGDAGFLFEEMDEEDCRHDVKCSKKKTASFLCDRCGSRFERSGDKRRAIEKRIEINPESLKFCSQKCNIEYQRSDSNISGRYRITDLYKKLEESEFRCALSGVKLTVDTMSIDHIVPVSKGGSDETSNLQFVHRVVNRMKGTMDDDEFVEWCSKVAGHPRQ